MFSVGSDESFMIQAQWDNSTVNPSCADAKSIKISGGNCTLNQDILIRKNFTVCNIYILSSINRN